MIIKRIECGAFCQNARILIDEQSLEGMFVDPGADVDRLLVAANVERIRYRSALITHAHLDHCGGAARLAEEFRLQTGKELEIIAHADGAELGAHVQEQAAMFSLSPQEFENLPQKVRYVSDGEDLSVGGLKGRVLYVPGHAPGHIALYFERGDGEIEDEDGRRRKFRCPLLFSGDVLFAGSIGRTDLPGGDYQLLMRSLRTKILTLPEDTLVLSGHGPDTTVGQELRSNPFLNE